MALVGLIICSFIDVVGAIVVAALIMFVQLSKISNATSISDKRMQSQKCVIRTNNLNIFKPLIFEKYFSYVKKHI